MPKCSFCNVEGHKITSCQDPRIAVIMNAVENAGSSANLNSVLYGFSSCELSVVMVQYGIPGVSMSKQRKIDLILNRCVRSTMASRLQEIRGQAVAPTRRTEQAPLSSEDVRELAANIAKKVCDATFAQATILYGRVCSGISTIEECVKQYNEYRRMIVTSALSEINSGPDDYITMHDYSSMVYEEMNSIVRLRSSHIAHRVYASLRDYGLLLRRSMLTNMRVRTSLFLSKKFRLMREALHECLLSPHEMEDVTRELEVLLEQSPIDVSQALPTYDRSHLKPLCIAVAQSSTKIDEVLQRDSVDECMICMTLFKSKEALEVPLMMGCEHICCTGCFVTMAKTRTKTFINCPFCREEVSQCITPNKESMDLVAESVKTA
jgi:hypothetical protein